MVQDDLHITNKPPPHQSARGSSQASKRPSALKRISTFLSPQRPAPVEAPRLADASAGGRGTPAATPRPAECSTNAGNTVVCRRAASLDATPLLGAATEGEAAAGLASTSDPRPSAACSSGTELLACNPSQAAHEEEEEEGEVRGVHGRRAAGSAGQRGHITVRNGVLEAVHLLVEQSREVPAARLRENMSGIGELCHIGLSGDFAVMPSLNMRCVYVPSVISDCGHLMRSSNRRLSNICVVCRHRRRSDRSKGKACSNQSAGAHFHGCRLGKCREP